LQAFSIFQLFYVFPREKVQFSAYYTFLLLPLVAITAFLTLTPLVFQGIAEVSASGQIIRVTNGPGIFVFAVVSIGLVVSGIMLLLKKMNRARGIEKTQFRLIWTGALIMFSLIVVFNFVFPAFLDNPRFIPLGAVFTFPFISLTAYAILKYGLFNVRVVATEILTLAVVIVTFFEVLISRSATEIIFRSAIFGTLLVFGILLIRSVRREVEQREQLEVLSLELAQANERLEELDKLKSEFISMAGHQLRAPLTVIKGYTSLILEGTVGGATGKIKEALEKVMFSTEQLIKLVSGLLDLSRIEAGKIKYDFTRGDLAKIAEEVIDKFRPSAGKKGLEIFFENKAGASTLTLDQDKIREAVVNYLDNAIKYSGKGNISVLLSSMQGPGGQWLRFEVKDSGLGFKKEDTLQLFGKFVRTEEARRLDSNGMGIGLYFVKRVVQDHGGNVGALSEGAGKGSTFWLELPMKKR